MNIMLGQHLLSNSMLSCKSAKTFALGQVYNFRAHRTLTSLESSQQQREDWPRDGRQRKAACGGLCVLERTITGKSIVCRHESGTEVAYRGGAWGSSQRHAYAPERNIKGAESRDSSGEIWIFHVTNLNCHKAP